MTCREIEDLILDSLDAPIESGQQRLLDDHLAGCAECRAFRQTQLALDGLLAAQLSAPQLRENFAKDLHRRIAADRRRTRWEYVPDALHLGGGITTSLVCAWLLPFSAPWVIAVGGGITVSAYLLQVWVRSLIEDSY